MKIGPAEGHRRGRKRRLQPVHIAEAIETAEAVEAMPVKRFNLPPIKKDRHGPLHPVVNGRAYCANRRSSSS